MVNDTVLIVCSQWGVSMMNDLCLGDLSSLGLHTAVLICPKKLFIAGQRGHMVRNCFRTHTFMQFGSLDDFNTVGVMFNLMVW